MIISSSGDLLFYNIIHKYQWQLTTPHEQRRRLEHTTRQLNACKIWRKKKNVVRKCLYYYISIMYAKNCRKGQIKYPRKYGNQKHMNIFECEVVLFSNKLASLSPTLYKMASTKLPKIYFLIVFTHVNSEKSRTWSE